MNGTRAAAMAAVEGLSVRYGGTVALDGVSLAAERGAVYALLGRNGAGKSSLVRCLLGEQRPAAGRTLLFGADAWRTRAAAMRRVGVVPETPDMPPAMSARRLAAFCAGLYERYDTRGTLDRLEAARVPLDTPAGSLSRGQRAQLSLALALGHGPELLVLDDPTLGLDAVARRTVFEELVGDLADRGTTVLLTTHDLAGVEGLADRVGILRAGRLVVDEPLEALKARFRRVTAVAANGSAAHGGERGQPGMEPGVGGERFLRGSVRCLERLGAGGGRSGAHDAGGHLRRGDRRRGRR